AEKVRQDGVLVLESLELADNKTRNLKALLGKLKLPDKVLIVTDEISDNLRLASRNIPDVHVLSYRSLSVYEMMKHNKVIFLKDALEAYKERLS
ncbi:MAG: 50S ribosomal protein L4, partial [SAR324 cluster bacterium]